MCVGNVQQDAKPGWRARRSMIHCGVAPSSLGIRAYPTSEHRQRMEDTIALSPWRRSVQNGFLEGRITIESTDMRLCAALTGMGRPKRAQAHGDAVSSPRQCARTGSLCHTITPSSCATVVRFCDFGRWQPWLRLKGWQGNFGSHHFDAGKRWAKKRIPES